MTDRKFGVELELVSATCDARTLASKLTLAGVETRSEFYNHSTRGYWKIVTDASLSGAAYMYELVSPILSGAAGHQQLLLVCEVLAANGVTVNASCGTHVHVDAQDADPARVRRLVKMYAKYEVCMDKLVAKSRRENNAYFCRSMYSDLGVTRTAGMTDAELATAAAAKVDALPKARTARDFAYSVSRGERYRKLNLVALSVHGTVEFRQHHGTSEGAKLVAWVKLVTGMVAAAFAAKTIKTAGAGELEAMLKVVDPATRRYFRKRATQLAGRRVA